MTDPERWAREQAKRAPRKHRRRTHWLGLDTKHPRCDGCGKQIWPGDNHSECREEA